MASDDSKSIPDIVVIGCVVLLVAVIGGIYFASSINKPTGPQALPTPVMQHLKQHPGMQPNNNSGTPTATNQ